jgi:linoleoyl-CoA desaturase
MQANNKRSNFIEALNEKANSYFKTRLFGQYASPAGLAKSMAYVLLFFAAYYYFIFFITGFHELLWVAVLLGISHVLIPVNISHDAIHNSVSNRGWINTLGRFGLELTGANSYMYSKKHLEAHYNKENGNKASSIESQGLLLKKKVKAGKVNLPYIFYAVYAQYMIFIRDFVLFYQSPEKIPANEFAKLYFSKIIYATAFLVLPFILIPLPWWQVLTSIMLMYLIITSLLVIILLMPTDKMENNKMVDGNSYNEKWVIEILEHNVDFSPGSHLLNYVAGGANLNVVHYFFPSVNHIHYTRLAALIEETAKEFGLLYRKQNVKDVLAIHFNYLKNIQHSDSDVSVNANKNLINE